MTKKGEKYEHRQNAVSVTLYDVGGNKLSDDLANRLQEYASELAQETETLAVNVART